MLSSSPAVPIHSINFADQQRRRLSLVTAHGQEIHTAHDGLPSPEHLTPISGTPYGHSPAGSDAGSAPISRRGSEQGQGYFFEEGTSLKKVPSRGGLWHDEVSGYGRFELPVRTLLYHMAFGRSFFSFFPVEVVVFRKVLSAVPPQKLPHELLGLWRAFTGSWRRTAALVRLQTNAFLPSC